MFAAMLEIAKELGLGLLAWWPILIAIPLMIGILGFFEGRTETADIDKMLGKKRYWFKGDDAVRNNKIGLLTGFLASWEALKLILAFCVLATIVLWFRSNPWAWKAVTGYLT